MTGSAQGHAALDRIDLLGSAPFVLVHLGCFLVFWAGFSWVALGVAVLLYGVRMFGITAGFHRYFSHRSFKTSRGFQFVLAYLGTMAGQMGPLWWASHHRHHHRFSDTEEDIHSPVIRGFFWSHVGWILTWRYADTNWKAIRDFEPYPELRFLNRFHYIAPLSLLLVLLGMGLFVERFVPTLHTTALQMVVWGFFISTVLLYHGTFSINTVCHLFGSRRYETKDHSRNNWLFALLTLGEGWHNNHHRYPGSERQGFYWWEIDLTHIGLKILSYMGLVYDLKSPPASVYAQGRLEKADTAKC
ncbi:MAG: acyl-CoA desaturase [bacterium]|jgi:stearoyl-CoA desaturase (delta-9 desaturase)|nr:acyl-CoA desaturase [bacterium]